MSKDIKTGLALLREPFAANQISKLPKPTAQQTKIVKEDFKQGMRCGACGGWHHKDVIHLDYVGHAALTDRLLDCDPGWFWEPLSLSSDGLPALDRDGGLWIRLTVCGVTRIGYGDAGQKTGGDATKERIGDAIRNAGMRYGAALDLWHKGDLHLPVASDQDQEAGAVHENEESKKQEKIFNDCKLAIESAANNIDLVDAWVSTPKSIQRALLSVKENKKLQLGIIT